MLLTATLIHLNMIEMQAISTFLINMLLLLKVLMNTAVLGWTKELIW
jgi:hypothetical protein